MNFLTASYPLSSLRCNCRFKYVYLQIKAVNVNRITLIQYKPSPLEETAVGLIIMLENRNQPQ